jgi:hypothetical protein
MNTAFEIGKIYFSTANSNTVEITVTGRTTRTVTFEYNGETHKEKISVYNGTEDFSFYLPNTSRQHHFYSNCFRQTGTADAIANKVRECKKAYSELVHLVQMAKYYGGDMTTEELDVVLMTAGLSKLEACEVLVKSDCYR